jgi:hypothetical protein
MEQIQKDTKEIKEIIKDELEFNKDNIEALELKMKENLEKRLQDLEEKLEQQSKENFDKMVKELKNQFNEQTLLKEEYKKTDVLSIALNNKKILTILGLSIYLLTNSLYSAVYLPISLISFIKNCINVKTTLSTILEIPLGYISIPSIKETASYLWKCVGRLIMLFSALTAGYNGILGILNGPDTKTKKVYLDVYTKWKDAQVGDKLNIAVDTGMKSLNDIIQTNFSIPFYNETVSIKSIGTKIPFFNETTTSIKNIAETKIPLVETLIKTSNTINSTITTVGNTYMTTTSILSGVKDIMYIPITSFLINPRRNIPLMTGLVSSILVGSTYLLGGNRNRNRNRNRKCKSTKRKSTKRKPIKRKPTRQTQGHFKVKRNLLKTITDNLPKSMRRRYDIINDKIYDYIENNMKLILVTGRKNINSNYKLFSKCIGIYALFMNMTKDIYSVDIIKTKEKIEEFKRTMTIIEDIIRYGKIKRIKLSDSEISSLLELFDANTFIEKHTVKKKRGIIIRN